ncbi:hypothetical protein KR009_004756, partial [Drosophila setifemur]
VPIPAQGVLSDQNLSQLLHQLRNVPQFEREPSALAPFVRRVDYLLQLYGTYNERQQSIIFGAIELQISGEAQKILQVLHINDWPNLRQALIAEYKTQTPVEELLRRLYNTTFQGNLRKFCNDVEGPEFQIIHKCHE